MERGRHLRLTPAERGRAVRQVTAAMQVEHRAQRRPLRHVDARAAVRRLPRRLAVMMRVEHYGSYVRVVLAGEALMAVELDGSIACTDGPVEIPANVPDVNTPEFAAGYARFDAAVDRLADHRATELRTRSRCGARPRGRRSRRRSGTRRSSGTSRAGPDGEPGEPPPHPVRGGAA